MNITITRGQLTGFGIALLAVLYKLWLVEVHDLRITGSGVDDIFYVRTANELLSGNWLGPYSYYTLSSGPFYPIWIATCYLLAVPLLLGQQLLYVAACVLVTAAIAPLFRRRGWLVVAFAFLLFNPYTYDYSSAPAAFRDTIYPALSLMVVGCAIGLYLRSGTPGEKLWGWASGLGLALAAFWYTREEGVWVLPPLLLALVSAFVYGIRHGRRHWAALLSVVLIPFLVIGATWTGLGYLNQKHYGVFVDLDINHPDFVAAYRALLKVRDTHPAQYYLSDPAQRDALAAASPAYREIRDQMEASGWKAHGRFPAVMYLWIVRDAAAHSGYYRPDQLQQTFDYYRRLANEIEAGCDDGRLVCRAHFPAMLPPLYDHHFEALWPMFRDLGSRVIRFDNFEPRMEAKFISYASFEELRMFEFITNERIRTPIEGALTVVPTGHSRFEEIKTHRMLRIGRDWYQQPGPWLALLSLGSIGVALLIALLRRRFDRTTVAALIASAALFSHLSVVSVFGVVATTGQRYLHPSVSLLLLVHVLGLLLLLRGIVSLYRRLRGSSQ